MKKQTFTGSRVGGIGPGKRGGHTLDLLASRKVDKGASAKYVVAMRAIQARINGVWDDPDLIAVGGPLLSDVEEDVLRIARTALA